MSEVILEGGSEYQFPNEPRKQPSRIRSQKECLLTFILFTSLVGLCCFLCFQLLVIQCRALLAKSAGIELSPNTVADFGVIENEASGADFYRLVALARLCSENDRAVGLRLVEIHYCSLTWTGRISAASAPRFAKHIQNETRACTYTKPLRSRSRSAVRAALRRYRTEKYVRDTYMDQRYMIKRYLARIRSRRGRVFEVFSTGLPGWLLFCVISGADVQGNRGYQTGLQFPVRRSDLRREISRAIP